MIDLDAFLPRITPYAPGVAEPTAFANIIKAAQIFCDRGRLWRNDVSVDVTPVSVNTIPVPVGAELFEIESARVAERSLEPISIAELDRRYADWRSQVNDLPRWYTQTVPGTVQLVPACTGTLDLSTFLRPTNNAQQLPDLFGQYLEEIADGALARILMIPAQPFTDPAAAQFYGQRFDNRMDSLFNRTVQGQQRAPIRTRARFM